jgi:hypothetical protein
MHQGPSSSTEILKEAPLLPLPTQPIITRSGTWLEAYIYYCEHYTTIEKVFNGFESSE